VAFGCRIFGLGRKSKYLFRSDTTLSAATNLFLALSGANHSAIHYDVTAPRQLTERIGRIAAFSSLMHSLSVVSRASMEINSQKPLKLNVCRRSVLPVSASSAYIMYFLRCILRRPKLRHCYGGLLESEEAIRSRADSVAKCSQ
jgi:hypothetical protein